MALFFSGSIIAGRDSASFSPEALSRLATALTFFRKHSRGSLRINKILNVSLPQNPKRETIKVMKKYLLASLLALLAFVGKAQEDNSDIVKVGDTMPSFTIISDNGSKLQSASLKGKVILVNFFATWCPPCQKELAAVQQTLWPNTRTTRTSFSW